MIVILPYPNLKLAANKSKGRAWQNSYRLRTEQRSTAFYLTKQAKIAIKDKKSPIALKITFVQNDKIRRDVLNLAEACKAMLDGVADALGIDDYYFWPITINRDFDIEAKTIMEILET